MPAREDTVKGYRRCAKALFMVTRLGVCLPASSATVDYPKTILCNERTMHHLGEAALAPFASHRTNHALPSCLLPETHIAVIATTGNTGQPATPRVPRLRREVEGVPELHRPHGRKAGARREHLPHRDYGFVADVHSGLSLFVVVLLYCIPGFHVFSAVCGALQHRHADFAVSRFRAVALLPSPHLRARIHHKHDDEAALHTGTAAVGLTSCMAASRHRQH